jgi:lysophospholipase L1-like esterase
MATNPRRQQPLTPQERAQRKAKAKKRRRRQSILTGIAFLLALVFLISTLCLARQNSNLKANSLSSSTRSQYEVAALARHTDLVLGTAGASPTNFDDGVDETFFDDAVFVGDSVSLKLQLYAEKVREAGGSCLGQAQFFTEGGLGWGNQLLDLTNKNGLHAEYNGTATYVEDAVYEMGVSKVYIMLGMNDVALYGLDQSILNAGSICDKIMEKNPDVQIFIESVTPMLASSETSKLNNTIITQFNEMLQSFCQENDYYYLDISSAVSDDSGCLKKEYCGDAEGMGMHFTDAGCEVWVDYLMNHPYGVDLSGSDAEAEET